MIHIAVLVGAADMTVKVTKNNDRGKNNNHNVKAMTDLTMTVSWPLLSCSNWNLDHAPVTIFPGTVAIVVVHINVICVIVIKGNSDRPS